MNNIQRITVEVDGETPFEYIIAKQGEANSRIVEVELMEKSVAYMIPEGVKAMVKYRKPDGKKVLNDCTYSGNIVTVTYTEQMLAAYGTGKGEIMLVKGTEIIKSATFYTKIVETVYKENGLISDNEFTSLAGTLIEVNQTLEKIDNAVTGAETALYEAGELKEQCKTATENADMVAETCNMAKEEMLEACGEAVEQANTATINATAAMNNANTAAETCNTAKEEMREACGEAVEQANTATTNATAATENASRAAETCNEATANATTAAEEANQAAEACNDIIDGLTPRIGEDGNWYVGKEDTGVKANGGITVYDGFDSESTTNAASAKTVKELKEGLDSHTHTKNEITDFPTAIKNPNALTLKLNGTSQGAYDGSSAKEVNITASSVGAAASSHTHNYAGSLSAGGTANSAVKLQTARNITIGQQSQSFDGTKNIIFDEKSMGFLKIINLDVKTTTFLKISCEAQTNYNGALITPKYFFMIVNNYSSDMGGYYISSKALSIPNPNTIGQSAGAISIKASKASNLGIFEISGGGVSSGTLNIIYDAANVEITQL